ncbi:MAG TPA: hypothetical protein PLI53_01660 [Geobacteraceae bacterium]|nr:hypothetical protein [Geobacteraceae bacterium]
MDRSLAYDPRKRGLTASTMHTASTPVTIDDGSGTTQYQQPDSVPMMKEITKPGKVVANPEAATSPASSLTSQGITVSKDKFGIEEIKGSPSRVSMTGLNPYTNTPQGASTVDPTARLMDPGDMVSKAINMMPLGLRRKEKPAMFAAIMQGLTAANNAMANAGGAFAEGDLKAQAILGDSRNDFAANVHASGINRDLEIMKNETDLAQLSETKRHNRAAEGINFFRATKTRASEADKEQRADLKGMQDEYGKLSSERTKQFAKDSSDFEERAAQAKAFGKPAPVWGESAAHAAITGEMYRLRDLAAENHGYDLIKRRPITKRPMQQGLTGQPKQTGGFVYQNGKLVPAR